MKKLLLFLGLVTLSLNIFSMEHMEEKPVLPKVIPHEQASKPIG